MAVVTAVVVTAAVPAVTVLPVVFQKVERLRDV